MPLNTDALTLLTLGIHGDQPVDSQQPPLPDGIHLRWFPAPDMGYPWHGFYLFRRESEPSRPRCLSPELRRFRPGPLLSARLETALGSLSSAKPFVFTDDFPATSLVEVDLNQGGSLRFDLPAGVEARRVDAQIGLRDRPQTTRTCADFRGLPLGNGPSPRTEHGAVFTTELSLATPPVAVTSIVKWASAIPGLLSSRRLEIALPCPATRVDLLLSNGGDLRVEALEANGASAGVKSFTGHALSASTVTLTGRAIARVTLQSSLSDAALLHEICWECPGPAGGSSGKGPAIEVRALAGTAVVASTVVTGATGQVVSATLQGAGITAVEVAAGTAALVDLCFWPSRQTVSFGWDEVRGWQYPLCLPVADAGYPCPSKPATPADARTLALSRVTYPAPAGWDQDFPSLHDELVLLVQGGPGGGPMPGRTHGLLTGQSLAPSTQADVPTLPGLRPLDLLLLASLHPAIAQELGLYFVDASAAPGVAYDYVLLADPTGVLGGSAASALAWLALTADPTKVDAAVVLGSKATAHPPIAPPSQAKAYALPGAATRAFDGVLREATGNIGLWWQLPPDSTVDRPDQIVFYYPHRVDHGTTEPSALPSDAQYLPLPNLSPVLVSEPDPSVPPNPRSSEWPPPAIPLHIVDPNLAEGWYGYRLSGQDLFGRRSPLGPPAEWFEWDPLPEHQRHAFAVALLDKIPPPPPLGVEAWALDPLDRWLLADPPYQAWRATVSTGLVGLRVRWRWTLMQQIQAPDTREFRLYYQPGRWNVLLGTIETVTAAAADQSDVTLDIADAHPPDAFAGARLRVGNDDFAILGSQPGAQLRLRMKNIGTHDEVRPGEGKPCTVALPEQHALWVDTSLAGTWAKRLAAVPYDPPARIAFDPSTDAKGRLLTGQAFAAAQLGATVTVNGATAQLPPAADLSGIQPWIDHLWLQDASGASQAHRILRYDVQAVTVTLETAPTLSQPVSWVVGRPAREYDVFLAAPDIGSGQLFEPSLPEPVVYAQIAVSAADDKSHALDDPKWSGQPLGDHFGNESRLSPSATVIRVLQAAPPAPELPDLPDRLNATPADYHGRSYFTFHFKPVEHLRIHVFRALDDSLFRRDWTIRETRTALDPANATHLDYLPDGPPAWDASRLRAAADAVNALTPGAPYGGLSDDAWGVLALLPGNEAQPDRAALAARDGSLRHTRTALAATDSGLYPPAWNQATRTLAADALNRLSDPAGYLSLPDNALRLLAGLPGNEAAFTQVTLQPLAMGDAAIRDRRGPDDPAAYSPDPGLRAYQDTIPGRATNRSFYRAVFVDGAHNQSALSLATPPVYLPRAQPPRAPVLTGLVGGDRQITLRWAANRDPDLAEVRVYQTASADAASDPRRMTLVRTLPAAQPRPDEESFTDGPVPGGAILIYRLVAVDTAGNASTPSPPISGSAFDDSRPAPPTWNPPVPGPTPGSLQLSWSSPATDLRCLVERQSGSAAIWERLGGWLPRGLYTLTDGRRQAGVSYSYRLRVLDPRGRANADLRTLTA